MRRFLLRKSSFVDFPGCISSVFFFSGCNLRCPWCHNGDLLKAPPEDLVDIEVCLAHIRKRRSVLGGVVLSGGEPCLYDGLDDLIAEIKKLSLSVKLDTNGMFPDVLNRLFGREETRPDYIALDLKLAPARYRGLLAGNSGLAGEGGLAGEPGFDPGEALIQSAALVRSSGITHEFRSLALPSVLGPAGASGGHAGGHADGFFSLKDIEALAPLVGGSPWILRPFRGGNCLDPAWDSFEENAGEASARAGRLAAKARELHISLLTK